VLKHVITGLTRGWQFRPENWRQTKEKTGSRQKNKKKQDNKKNIWRKTEEDNLNRRAQQKVNIPDSFLTIKKRFKQTLIYKRNETGTNKRKRHFCNIKEVAFWSQRREKKSKIKNLIWNDQSSKKEQQLRTVLSSVSSKT